MQAKIGAQNGKAARQGADKFSFACQDPQARRAWRSPRSRRSGPKRRATLGPRPDDETPAKAKEVCKPDDRIMHRSRQPFEILYSGSTDGSNGDADVE